mgnify:CR=1 FL=1
MKVSSLLKGGIYEVSFGYKPKMEGYAKYCGYTTLSAIFCKKYQHNITKRDTFIGGKKEQIAWKNLLVKI